MLKIERLETEKRLVKWNQKEKKERTFKINLSLMPLGVRFGWSSKVLCLWMIHNLLKRGLWIRIRISGVCFVKF